MRRLMLFLLAVTLMLPAVGIAHAQGTPPLFELSETFTVTDLAFEFKYPAGWVYDTSDGISMAANQADLNAEIDDNDATRPAGYTISLNAAPLEALGLTEPTLDNAIAALVEAIGITVTEQVETPIMTRRAVSLAGSDPQGEAGVATIWLQDGMVVVFSMGIPGQEITDQEATAWVSILLSCKPLTDAVLSAEAQVNLLDGFSMAYPKGWMVGEDPNLGTYFFELASDLQISLNAGGNRTQPLQGDGVIMIASDLKAAGFTAQTTPTEVIDTLVQGGVITDPVNHTEHVLFDQPALSVEYIGANGDSGIIIAGVVGTNVYLILGASPTPETMAALKPTLLSMLMSITPLQ